jgi:hypothetical protein
MNERITQLVEQARKYASEYVEDEVEMQFHKKFAELIVRECADVIQKEVSMKYKDGGETEEFMGGHYAGSLLARAKIKQHFGVE